METMNVKALKAVMIAQSIGVTELSRRANIRTCLVSSWLKHEKVSVRLPTISKITKALNVDANDLLVEV